MKSTKHTLKVLELALFLFKMRMIFHSPSFRLKCVPFLSTLLDSNRLLHFTVRVQCCSCMHVIEKKSFFINNFFTKFFEKKKF